MMGKVTSMSILILLLTLLAAAAAAEKGRIYGRIYTDRGDVLEGPIRWDKNEASWDDLIDGSKDRSEHADKSSRRRYYEDESKVKVFGVTLFSEGGWGGQSEAGVAFGHLKELTPDGDDEVELLFKSGERVMLTSGSTDFGSGIREIVVETKDEGEVEIDWEDIDHIEFLDSGDIQSNFGRRLYGTVTSSRAGEFTGWICWDMDEMFVSDIIDGSERGRSRKIKFAQITKIERLSSQASEITTKDGKVVRLDDSNDIDSGNRGIVVSDANLGRVIIPWDEFETMTLTDPPEAAYPKYADFDGGRRLHGTVVDEDGSRHTGLVIWDDDEEFTWEILDGSYRGVEYDIPFEKIQSIEKDTRRTCEVTLWDGRKIRLRDSNDVNEDNKGIFVNTDSGGKKGGNDVELDWDEFARIDFTRK